LANAMLDLGIKKDPKWQQCYQTVWNCSRPIGRRPRWAQSSCR
jgi:hypothetical protein